LRRLIGASALLLSACFLSSAATLVTGTSNSSDNSTGAPTGLSPVFGTLINFDNLTPNTLLSSSAYAASGVTSIAATNGTVALSAVPFSGQSQPNYIGPANFSNIDILITLSQSTSEIGVGLLAGSSNNFTLRALGAGNSLVGTFAITVPSDGVRALNAYYAIQDSVASIQSLEIVGNGGIDDLQFATATAVPEPTSFGLIGGGVALMGAIAARRRKK
jgi:hypothetical protein